MKIPIIESNRDRSKDGEPVRSYSDCRALPASYMSEHSVLGLIVDKLPEAIQVLLGAGFHVTVEDFGAELEVGSAARVPGLVEMLAKAGIYSSIGDVIDSVYQG